MSSDGAAPRAAGTVSSARAEASRTNGARSRGPKTPEGKARSAQNALKHGMRAQKHVLLPDEDAAEFATLEAALLIEELQPVGALQTVLARRGRGRHVPSGAGGSVGRRNGVGAPFPNSAANRPSCSRSGRSRRARSGSP